MAWNEPGKDKKPEEQGPPDLDQIFRQFWQKLTGSKGQKSTPTGDREPTPTPTTNPSVLISVVLGLSVIIWGLSGIFIVSPAEQTVILQFGRYQSTVGPGPHWIPRFICSKMTVNVQKISTYSYESQMLTKDQNIVDVSVAVQYRIADTKDYLFNVVEPVKSLQQATASALRQVIGNTNLDEVLTTGRAAIRDAVVQQVNQILAIYKTGIYISDVALQPAKAPEQVKDAFDDAIKAQEDEQRYINQSQAYAKEVVPAAQGKAKRAFEEAEAYRQQIVLNAKADVARFQALLPAYREAPEVTRKRLYLDTITSVLSTKNKVLMDSKANQNMLYLPFDKWFSAATKANATPSNQNTTPISAANQANAAENAANNPSGVGLANDRLTRFAFVNPDSEIGSREGAR